MQNFRTLLTSLVIVVLSTTLSTEALAKRPQQGGSTDDGTTSSLSYRTVRTLAKTYLDDFQSVDPDISYRDLIHYIYGLGASSETEAETALQAYLASLQTTSPPANQPPTISGSPSTSVDEGQPYLFRPASSDPDGDNLVFQITNKPAWAGFDSTTGTLSGTPASGAAGLYSGIVISVSDGEMSATLGAFDIQVNQVVQAPLAGPPTLKSVAVTGSDIQLSWVMENAIPEGGYDTFIDGVDTGAQYRTTGTSVALGGLDLTLSHCFVVESRYTDSGEFYASNQLCSEALAEPNQAPSISGSPATSVTESERYLFAPGASDPDGDSLTFSIANQPAWASFDSATGTLSGTPASGTAGLYGGIAISVSDGEMSATLSPFDILVSEAVQAPLAGPPTLTSVAVTGSDIQLSWVMENATPDGGYDTFIDGVDTGTQYRTTGTSVTLSGLDLTLSHCFVVESRYTDSGEFYASNQLCSEAQEAPNQAPLISGTPASTATAEVSYSFTPSSSDADGDTLSFSVLNLPSWASFDAASGTLYGVPEAGDAGSYTDIVIQVTDGQDTASLAPFTLTVEDAATASSSASLSWVAPSTRADGSPLGISEIDGYRIYVGESASTLVPVMDINDCTITEHTVTGLAAGTHYFGVTAYDMEGNESGISNVISKTTM